MTDVTNRPLKEKRLHETIKEMDTFGLAELAIQRQSEITRLQAVNRELLEAAEYAVEILLALAEHPDSCPRYWSRLSSAECHCGKTEALTKLETAIAKAKEGA